MESLQLVILAITFVQCVSLRRYWGSYRQVETGEKMLCLMRCVCWMRRSVQWHWPCGWAICLTSFHFSDVRLITQTIKGICIESWAYICISLFYIKSESYYKTNLLSDRVFLRQSKMYSKNLAMWWCEWLRWLFRWAELHKTHMLAHRVFLLLESQMHSKTLRLWWSEWLWRCFRWG